MSKFSFTQKNLDKIVKNTSATYEDDQGINHLEGLPIPDRKAILAAVEDLLFVLFPGFTGSRPVSHVNVEHMIGDLLYGVYRVLSREVETAFRYQCKVANCGDCDCASVAGAAVAHLLSSVPIIREVLKTDVAAAFDHDPAANSFDEIILSYPGIKTISIHRLAHELYKMHVPLVPRLINEWAHSKTGIDIHPGATIGERFFIDHGTGVVIGETTVIGRNVCVYHGVTLGAAGAAKGQQLHGQKRHPTIEDDVVIYPGATIIGGDTVIGKGCTIGGNVSLTESVPPYTLVTMSSPELVFLDKKAHKGKKSSDKSKSKSVQCPAREFCESKDCSSNCKTVKR